MLSAALLFMREDLDVAARHAAAAVELSRRTADREPWANAAAMSAVLQVVVGRSDGLSDLARGRAARRSVGRPAGDRRSELPSGPDAALDRRRAGGGPAVVRAACACAGLRR